MVSCLGGQTIDRRDKFERRMRAREAVMFHQVFGE
jgi:hypothetical protein